MLSEIFFPREAGAGAALAVVEGAEEGFLGPAVHFVHFAFVAEQAAAVGEALEFLAAFDVAFVRTVVLVHVLAVKFVSIDLMSRDEQTYLHSHFLSKKSPAQSWCLQIILPSWFLGGSSARL